MTCQMNIRIDQTLSDQLKAIAEREDRSLAQTVRHALRRYVKEAS